MFRQFDIILAVFKWKQRDIFSEFDNTSVDNIAAMVFKGMRSGSNQSDTLTRDDIRVWTKAIMAKKHPDVPFDENAFEKGFQSLDQDKDGKVTV